MNDQWGRYRTDFSAVTASAARLAENAMATAGSAVEAANRKLEGARDAQARRRDPKAKHRRALRAAKNTMTGWGATASTAAATTVVGFAAVGPVVGGAAAGVTTVMVVPLAYACAKFRRLKHAPTPPRGYARRELPATGSALYKPMRIMANAEQQFLALTAVLASSGALPSAAITDLDDEADAAASAITEYAAQLAGVERAAGTGDGPARGHLARYLSDGLAQVEQGVQAYADMVESAGITVAAAQGSMGALGGFDGAATARLRENTDRLRAWGMGIAELPRTPNL